jgi:hypothetical protein
MLWVPEFQERGNRCNAWGFGVLKERRNRCYAGMFRSSKRGGIDGMLGCFGVPREEE